MGLCVSVDGVISRVLAYRMRDRVGDTGWGWDGSCRSVAIYQVSHGVEPALTSVSLPSLLPVVLHFAFASHFDLTLMKVSVLWRSLMVRRDIF